MQIKVTTQTFNGKSVAVIEHQGKELQWDISAYAKTSERASTVDIHHMFDEINAYWLTVDAEHLDAIWTIYTQIRAEFNSIGDFKQMNKRLRDMVGRLYNHVNLDNILHWMLFHSNVRIPNGLKDEYAPTDSPDRTYLRTDYHKLAALAISLRPMVPIWGEYLVLSKQDAGPAWKEYYALSLLYNTYLNECEAMVKLRAFVQNTVDSNMQAGSAMTAVVGGLSTEEFHMWVLATTLTRRVAVGEVSAPNDTSTLITNTYNYINNTWRSGDRKLGKPHGGKLSEKKPFADGASDEDKTSHIENYKVKQQVADGDLTILSAYTERVFDMANKIDPGIAPYHVQLCLDFAQTLLTKQIPIELSPLTQWPLSSCLTPRGIPLLPKPAMIRAMAVAQAALWHWGFYDLAALVTASRIDVDEDVYISGNESRNSIPKDLRAELEVLYPYYRPSRAKQESSRKLNVAFRAVDDFTDVLTTHDWYINAPDALLSQCSTEGESRRMSIPIDIRTQLAKLIIKLATDQGQSA